MSKNFEPIQFLAQAVLTKAVYDSKRLRKKAYLTDIRDFIDKEAAWFKALCDISGRLDSDIYEMININLISKGY